MKRVLLLLMFALPAMAQPVTVHVTVALCDDASQGILPVPAAIGNGDDPRNNLYWSEKANGVGTNADVVAYVGHDGLMEFDVSPRAGGKPRKAIVLGCASRQYFGRRIPDQLLMTNRLMAPEAYTLTAALEAWIQGTSVTEAAAQAYHRFQKCGIHAARNLFAQPVR